MARRKKEEDMRLRNEVRRLRALGVPETDIEKHLGMERTVYWRLRKKIEAEDKHWIQTQLSESIAHEIRNLKDRLERKYAECELILNDSKASNRDKTETIRLQKEIAIDIVRLGMGDFSSLYGDRKDDNRAAATSAKEGADRQRKQESGSTSISADEAVQSGL